MILNEVGFHMGDTPSADRFEWLTLETDEELLWGETPHRLSLYVSVAVGLPLCLLLVGIPLVISSYLDHTRTHYVVTNQAVYKKTGVFSRNVKRIEFDKVQNTSYQQTFIGSKFGYGTVEVATAGTGGVELLFRNVANPRTIQSIINEQSTDTGGDESTQEKQDVLEEILSELTAIRRTVSEDTEPTIGISDPSNGDTETIDESP